MKTVAYTKDCGRYIDSGPLKIVLVESLKEIRDIFGGDKLDMTMNWFFLSTSGIHGSSLTLDDITPLEEFPAGISDVGGMWVDDETGEEVDISNDITILILKPRTLHLYFGNIEIETREEIDWLRGMVSKTLEGVCNSQVGNT